MYIVPEKLTTIVKGTTAKYLYCDSSCLIYEVETDNYRYEFSIDQRNRTDIGNAIFNRTEKAIHLMRYINIAIKDEKLKWTKK
jgi:hypothetical protein